MTLDEASKSLQIRWHNSLCYVNDAQHLYFDFSINPNDFLSFAEKDIAIADEVQALVNCLTNAKRAIDSQVSRVLSALGFSIKRKSFKTRFEILRDTGIVAPRIIQKVRDIRNELEHEYSRPERKDVEEALDVATLFVLAIDRVFLLFPLEVFIYNPEDAHEDEGRLPINCLIIRFNNDVNPPYFEVDIRRDSRSEITFEIRPKDHFYIPIIRLFISIQREVHVDEAMQAIGALVD